MPYPTLTDYRLHLRLQTLPFVDDDFKNGRVIKRNANNDPWGAGGFAGIWKFQRADNSTGALRCLTSRGNNVQTRYAAIGTFIENANSPYFVKVQFMPQERGIIINRQKYPFIFMEWVEGQTLWGYTKELVRRGDKKGLRELSKEWIRLVRNLWKLGVAHGDLADGNVMVRKSHSGTSKYTSSSVRSPKIELALVDYDTVYVPAIRHLGIAALGTLGYKHPNLNRSNAQFNQRMDSFSALVILTSLCALAWKPGLWPGLNDILLFRPDELQPGSQWMQDLKNADSEEVKFLAEKLADVCAKSDPKEVQPLIELLDLCVACGDWFPQGPDYCPHCGHPAPDRVPRRCPAEIERPFFSWLSRTRVTSACPNHDGRYVMNLNTQRFCAWCGQEFRPDRKCKCPACDMEVGIDDDWCQKPSCPDPVQPPYVTCRNCGHKNRMNFVFCWKCGEPLYAYVNR